MLKENPLTTDLVGDKTTKTDERVAFFGAVDELSAHIMELTHYIEDVPMQMELRKIVSMLSTMMAEVAGGLGHIGEKHLNELIEVVKKYEEQAGPFTSFVLPGTTLMGARVHVVRTVTRRAELAYAKVYEKYGGSGYIFEYLNKMSTLFYAIARIYDER
ncbi:MAG TPA: ATP:cob(I)alamin adenosyltransferase [Candidatus Coproplasma excrementipullorum]|nr:ATP:cob(I)alamin adenosyltransferase [Candidatus Coproplasma excrementipullorum]